MEFGWHTAKHLATQRSRGFGFDIAALIFDGQIIEQIDDRRDYGEVRVKAIGETGDEVFVVVYTDREDVRWIISARRASRKERRLWQTTPHA